MSSFETLTGEAAVAHNERIVAAVAKKCGGDEVRLKQFKSATKNLGKGKASAAEVSFSRS